MKRSVGVILSLTLLLLALTTGCATAENPPSEDAASLSEEEERIARVAWQYFEKNYQEQTGLVNSAHGFPSTTLWDLASYLGALESAFQLGVISEEEHERRLDRLLESLSSLELFLGRWPHVAYDTRSLEMVTYQNEPVEDGERFSAIDLGRLLIWLAIIAETHPEYAQRVQQVVDRWDLDLITTGGQLYGARRLEGIIQLPQEGRLGYEQYAARGFALWGLSVAKALDWEAYSREVDLMGVRMAVDRRTFEETDAYSYLTSDPYFLLGLEVGWDSTGEKQAATLYQVQKRRYEEEGVLTAVAEGHVDRSPYFVYYSVFLEGEPWKVIDAEGNDAESLKFLSTKGAFAFHYLYEDAYSHEMFQAVKDLYDPELGYYGGIYEGSDGGVNRAIDANTNGVVLEALLYHKLGRPILRDR